MSEMKTGAEELQFGLSGSRRSGRSATGSGGSTLKMRRASLSLLYESGHGRWPGGVYEGWGARPPVVRAGVTTRGWLVGAVDIDTSSWKCALQKGDAC